MWPCERERLFGEDPDKAALRRLAWYGTRRALALSSFWVAHAVGWQRAYEARILTALCAYGELQRKGDEDDVSPLTDLPMSLLKPMQRKAIFERLDR
jgi:hypothetical protein